MLILNGKLNYIEVHLCGQLCSCISPKKILLSVVATTSHVSDSFVQREKDGNNVATAVACYAREHGTTEKDAKFFSVCSKIIGEA